MTAKMKVLGVDYADDVEAAFWRGELGDTPLIEAIMDNALEAGMTHVAWRVSHIGKLTYRTKVGTSQNGQQALRLSLTPFGLILQRCDPLEVAVRAAHERGLKIFFYITLFDEAYEEPTGELSESWIGQQHPEYYIQHFCLPQFIRGVLSFGYPEVRRYFLDIVREGLGYGCDGVYLDCGRTHAGAHPIPVYGWWPQWTHPFLAYGYNEPDVARYQERYGEPPPRIEWTDTRDLEPTAADENWGRVRGEALTEFMREVRPLAREHEASVNVSFFPTTYNGFNPGYHCRQILGRFHVDWETWVEEGLVDMIRLNVDHRRFGYDDWIANSASTYKKAQDKGVKILVDCAIEGKYDEVEDPPAALPIVKTEQPDLYFELMDSMVRKMLDSTADGIAYYEHAGNDERTWHTLRSAHEG